MVNASIITAATAPDSPSRQMGSTVVLALLQQDATGVTAWIGHGGDSRADLVHAAELIRITNDHSAVQALLNRNLITPEQAFTHPDTSVLTRSMGNNGQVEIEIDMVPIDPGDNLLLCPDGLWAYVAESEIRTVVSNPCQSANSARSWLGGCGCSCRC
jgi:protein phosphatase